MWPCWLVLQLQASLLELAEESLMAKVQEAQANFDTANSAVENANKAVEAAQRELAGAEAGDGRDESNRSLQERLADAETGQVSSKLS